LTLRLGEQHELVLRMLEVAEEGARREGHSARQGIIHGQRAAVALAQGSLKDAQVEAETGLLLVDKRHFAALQLIAVAAVVMVEGGDLAPGEELTRAADAIGVAEDRSYLIDYLVARGRLRIAQGRVREGIDDLLWCGARMEARGVHWPSDWRAFAA